MQKLERKIIAFLSEKPASFWQLLEALDCGELEAIKALKSLKKAGVLKAGEQISLLNPGSFGKKSFGELLGEFEALTGNFAPSKSEFYQERILLSDIVKKIKFMEERFDLQGAELIFLGDDDCASIAAALTGLPKRITVLDADNDVLSKISSVSEEKGLGIEFRRHNFMNRFPEDLKAGFDAFVTEPPEASFGLQCFISAGLCSLKGEGCAGYVGITRRESSGAKWLELQKKLAKSNAFVSDVLRSFQTYPEFSREIKDFGKMPLKKKLFFNAGSPDSDWWKCALMRIELAKSPKPLQPSQKTGFLSDKETLTVFE